MTLVILVKSKVDFPIILVEWHKKPFSHVYLERKKILSEKKCLSGKQKNVFKQTFSKENQSKPSQRLAKTWQTSSENQFHLSVKNN